MMKLKTFLKKTATAAALLAMTTATGFGLNRSYAAQQPGGIEAKVISLQEEFDAQGAPLADNISACTTYKGLEVFVGKDTVKAFINGGWVEMPRNDFFDKNPSKLDGTTILEQDMGRWGLEDTDLLNASTTLSFELGGPATGITIYKPTGENALFEETADAVIPHIDITGFGSFSLDGAQTLTLTYIDNGDKIAFYPQPGSAGALSGEYRLRGFNSLLGNAVPGDEEIEGHDFTVENGVLKMLICTNKGIYRFEDISGAGTFALEDYAHLQEPAPVNEPATGVSASLAGTIRYKDGSVTLNCSITDADGGTNTEGTGIYYNNNLLVPGEGTYTANGTIPKGETIEGRCNADGLASSAYTTVQDTACEISVKGAKSKYNEGDNMNIVFNITDADGDDYTPSISGAVPNGATASTWLNHAGIGGTISGDAGNCAGGSCSYSNTISAGTGPGSCKKTIGYMVNDTEPPFL